MNDPELLLLDECTVGLDPDIAEKTRRALKEFQREKHTTILFTSHNMNEVEELCGRIAFLSKGQILRIDTAERIKQLIPQQTLAIRFRSGTTIPALPLSDGLPSAEVGVDSTLRFVLHDSEHQLDAILRYFTESGATIADIRIVRPTLEDVFIKVARGEI
jgi:ABC-2 type transport system ATP-binding protein